MKAALRAEHRKLISTQLWWVLLILSAAYLGFIGATLAFSLSIEEARLGVPDVEGVDAAASVYSLVNAVGYVFPLVIGSLLMTSEFRHRTITQSLLVEPRRTVLLVSKLLIAIPVGLVYGIVGVGAFVAGGAPVLAWRGDGAFLTDAEIVPVLLLGVVVTCSGRSSGSRSAASCRTRWRRSSSSSRSRNWSSRSPDSASARRTRSTRWASSYPGRRPTP